MFDLEKAVVEWRRQMRAAGVRWSAVLDELESHLRDEVDKQVRSGLSAQLAFESALNQMGHPSLLKKEFSKIARTRWAWLWKLKSFFMRPSVSPVSSLNGFNAGAQEALALARAEAPRFHHDFIGTEHVLLGLMALENGVVANLLRRVGVDRAAVQVEIERLVGVGPDNGSQPEIPWTPRARKALQLATAAATALNHPQIGPEHIFLGLIEEGSGVAAVVLRNLGVDLEIVRSEIRRISAAGS